jgi:hypothetical protein
MQDEVTTRKLDDRNEDFYLVGQMLGLSPRGIEDAVGQYRHNGNNLFSPAFSEVADDNAELTTLRAERDRLAPFEKLYAQDDFDRMDREFFLQQLESLGIEVTRRTDGNLRTRSTRNARAEKAEAERDRMREALNLVLGWSEAYPVDVFPQQDLTLAEKVLKKAGISMSAMHGNWARHLIENLGKIADAALNPPEEKP